MRDQHLCSAYHQKACDDGFFPMHDVLHVSKQNASKPYCRAAQDTLTALVSLVQASYDCALYRRLTKISKQDPQLCGDQWRLAARSLDREARSGVPCRGVAHEGLMCWLVDVVVALDKKGWPPNQGTRTYLYGVVLRDR